MPKQLCIQVWGVINITPDSFSDGGKFSHPTQIFQQIQEWNAHGVDIGAESTNPKALSISLEEEKARLEAGLIPLLMTWPKGLTLSLDTYKIETIRWVMSQIPQAIDVVWNDVSGHLPGVVDILNDFPKLRYVCCHNPAPSRDLSGQHMQYVQESDVNEVVKNFFDVSWSYFEKHGLTERVIADPCFGFGKTREQNLMLMESLPEFMDQLKFQSWMWGVSRKSFLRREGEDPTSPSVQAELDQRQLTWALKSLEKLQMPHTIILRAHNPLALGSLWKSSSLEK